jgi:hypothetical protein
LEKVSVAVDDGGLDLAGLAGLAGEDDWRGAVEVLAWF